MAIGRKEQRDTFVIQTDPDNTSGTPEIKLEANAPEEWQSGVKIPTKIWFFESSQQTSGAGTLPVLQTGPITPEKLILNFRFNGDLAIDNTRALEQLCAARKQVLISWAVYSYKVIIESVVPTYKRKEVSIVMTCQPLQDLATTQLQFKPISIPPPLPKLNSDLGNLLAQAAALLAQMQAVKNAVILQELQALQAVSTFFQQVNNIGSQISDLANTPSELFAPLVQMGFVAKASLTAATDAFTSIFNGQANPAYDLVAQLELLFGIHEQMDQRITIISNSFTTPAVKPYITRDGDTFQTLADQFKVNYFDLMSANPSVATAAGLNGKIPTGTSLSIPILSAPTTVH